MYKKIRHSIRLILEKSVLGSRLLARYRAWSAKRMKRKASMRLQRLGPEIFMKIHDVLTPIGVPYFASYGTLLGIVRDHGFIPHDDDMDFGVLPNCDDRNKVIITLLNSGFSFRRAFEYDGKIVEVALSYKMVTVDFFFFDTDGTKVWADSFTTGGVYPAPLDRIPVLSIMRGFLPLTQGLKNISILGAEVPIPNNAEDVLSAGFGEDWRTPISAWPGKHEMPNRIWLKDKAYVVGEEIVREIINDR